MDVRPMLVQPHSTESTKSVVIKGIKPQVRLDPLNRIPESSPIYKSFCRSFCRSSGGEAVRRTYHQLSARTVATLREPGVYRDGAGLYLKVGPTGSKTWVYRFMLRGRARWMGLGSADTFSLVEARRRAADCRKLLADGVDPLDARKAERTKLALDAAKSLAFAACATAYIEAHRAGWRNEKHVGQ
jgi:hypothetical protein